MLTVFVELRKHYSIFPFRQECITVYAMDIKQQEDRETKHFIGDKANIVDAL